MKVAKVKGHPADEMVEDCGVGWQDKDGHEVADGPAALGRRRQLEHINSRRIQNGSSFRYPLFVICIVFSELLQGQLWIMMARKAPLLAQKSLD